MLLYVRQRTSQLGTVCGTIFTAGATARQGSHSWSHQADPEFAGGATSLGMIPALPCSGFKLSPFLLQRPGPNEILVGCGHN